MSCSPFLPFYEKKGGGYLGDFFGLVESADISQPICCQRGFQSAGNKTTLALKLLPKSPTLSDYLFTAVCDFGDRSGSIFLERFRRFFPLLKGIVAIFFKIQLRFGFTKKGTLRNNILKTA